METKFVEAIGTLNWGKFMVGRFTQDEWDRRSEVDGRRLVAGRGWDRHRHLLVFDLQTGEGALFWPHANGMARMDLAKHKIWVCPLYEPFLEWLYLQDPDDLDVLPDRVELMDAEPSMYGYRRAGD